MRILKPVIAILIVYGLLKYGIPFIGSKMHPGTWPIIPTSVMKMYMFVVVVGFLLIFTRSESGYSEVVAPIADIYANPSKKVAMIALSLIIGGGGAFIAYQYVKPTFEAPIELRSIHPAPPSSIKVWNKSFTLQTLENPYRVKDKAELERNTFEGGIVFFRNCFFCHGDRMLGKGLFARGFNPLPANFVDVGTIAQLTESFVFWRVSEGGPGLPSEGTPWLSAMPVWNTMLSEEDVWKAILFIYDYTGHHPRVTKEAGKE